MVYCTNCGTQFDGKFCPNCGTAVEAGTTASAGPGPSPLQNPAVNGLSNAWASVICYIVPFVGPLLFLVLAPYNREPQIRFNAWQALFLQLCWIAAHVVANIVGLASWQAADALHQIIGWVFLAATLVMAVKAYQQEKVVLPYIGPLAAKQK